MHYMSAFIPLVIVFVILYVVLRRKPRARTENLEPIKSVLFGNKRKK